MVLRHRTMVAGWVLDAELVLHAIGTMQVRINGAYHGAPLRATTLSQGRRQYMSMLKQLSRPRQLTLPL